MADTHNFVRTMGLKDEQSAIEKWVRDELLRKNFKISLVDYRHELVDIELPHMSTIEDDIVIASIDSTAFNINKLIAEYKQSLNL